MPNQFYSTVIDLVSEKTHTLQTIKHNCQSRAGAMTFLLVSAGVAFSLFTLAFALVYLYYRYSFGYWKRRGVPHAQPSFPYGSTETINNGISFGAVTADFYREFKRRGYKYGGVFAGPSPKLLLADLELIKGVLAKDFQYFTGRGNYYNEEDEPLGAHLFNLEGKKWKNLRAKLTPTFTSGKMKMMFNTLVDCSKNMEAALEGSGDFDVKDVCARFTTDVIGSCAFGIDCNSFTHPDAEFLVMGTKGFGRTAYIKAKKFFALAAPELAKLFHVTVFMKEVVTFFNRIVRDIIATREANNIRRNDFMQLMIDMKNSVKLEDMDEEAFSQKEYTLSMEEIAAQAFLFFIAGFDTSSSTMQFCLYELARNEKLQEKARREVEELYNKNGGTITYEGVMELKFLAQAIDETLRKYPVVPTLTRKCEKDYPLPGTTLERDTLVLIPVYGIHHDEEFYPDPERFDPERFSEENKKKIPPYAYMPFGEGPKICLGLRFGLMQVKVGLCALLRNFQFKVSPKTEAVEVDRNSFLITTVSPIYLECSKVKRD